MAGCLTHCVNLIATKAASTRSSANRVGSGLPAIERAALAAHSYPCRSDAQEGITPAIRALIA